MIQRVQSPTRISSTAGIANLLDLVINRHDEAYGDQKETWNIAKKLIDSNSSKTNNTIPEAKCNIMSQYFIRKLEIIKNTIQERLAKTPISKFISELSLPVDILTTFENGLLLNPNKTEAILFGSRKQTSKYKNDLNIAFSGTTITTINSVKILGVILDSKLSMDKHINNIIKSCNYHIRALRHIRPCLTKEAANIIACGIVNSQLDYCNSILSGTYQKNIKKLQRIQNNLSRIVFHSPFHLKSEILLKSLHWLPIHQRIIYKISVITYKILLPKSPAYLFELLEVRTSKQNTRLLDSCQLTRRQQKTFLASKSFCMIAPQFGMVYL
ncbi:uncharacterized protein LOC136095107 [Hydra vulgaris]|uniref:uncharacterized protein LOC136095107 n=1 Tax=Hydra vulgaris TaxID=6087 RepID=UPI0032EA8029